jgi:phosphoribosylaminoimidazole-succinocarboxamide synthase
MISTSMHEISKRINVDNFGDLLEGRSMLVRKATPLKIECVVRGYISGSGWKEYKQLGTICGIKLPSGLVESDKLPEPIFTPSTKAPAGEHDENISFEEACKIIGEDLAVKVRDLSLALYNFGYEYALERGIIIADTKFEFGILNGEVILIDEVLTPDSSRFWPVATYKPGGAQESFDKQYVRDYLQQLCNEGKWDKTNKNVPELPRDVVEVTTKKYLEALRILRS